MSYYYILYVCTIIGAVLSHALSNALIETTDEMIKRQSMKCNNHCPYGYVSDVEGELTCVCFDPCSVIMCQPGYKCEASMPKNCSWGICRPAITCTVAFIKMGKGEDFIRSWREIPDHGLNDDPFIPRDSDDSVCSQPIPRKAQQCKQKQRRWFYNLMTGKCERFDGCSIGGNNFVRKRHCKAQCKGYIIPTEHLQTIEPDDSACEKPPSYKDMHSCGRDMKHKRWFYNENTGLCEKFTGCDGPGNNFSRKVFCKAKCRNVIVKYRRSKGIGSHSRAHSPR